jgi:hypothetical protein
MKARVKATGEIIEVKEGTQIIFKDGSIGLGFRTDNGEILNDYQLDFKDVTQEKTDVKEKSLPKDEPDYWDKLHHQAIIATLQGILSNPEQIALCDIDCVEQAVRIANLLINKLKEEEK